MCPRAAHSSRQHAPTPCGMRVGRRARARSSLPPRTLPPRTPQVGKTCVEISCASYATACRTDTGHVWRWGGKWDSAVPRTARLLGHLRLAPQALGCATHSARAAEPGRAQGRLRCDPEGRPEAWTPPRSTPRRWGGSAVAPLEPMRIRLGGSARCVAAGGSHVAVALGELLGDAADRSLARQASCCCTSTARQCAPHVTCTARHVHRMLCAPHVMCIAMWSMSTTCAPRDVHPV